MELIRVRSKKIAKIMHTHTDGARNGYAVRQLPKFAGLSSNVRCFTIYQLGYTLDLNKKKFPISHSRLLLPI